MSLYSVDLFMSIISMQFCWDSLRNMLIFQYHPIFSLWNFFHWFSDDIASFYNAAPATREFV